MYPMLLITPGMSKITDRAKDSSRDYFIPRNGNLFYGTILLFTVNVTFVPFFP